MAKLQSRAVRKPQILITPQDLEILETMVGNSAANVAAIRLLEDELARAVVVKKPTSARPFCRIGSWVSYQDLSSGQIRNVRLVLPKDADIDKQQVSVLSLVGASLLGLKIGAEFGWADDRDRPHRLKLLDVSDEAPAAA